MSVFEFNANTPAKRSQLPLAKNTLRKLRTIRHPDVLKFLDGVETETTVHIMTERVRPLSVALQDASSKTAQEREDWILWGLHRVSVRSRSQVLRVGLAHHDIECNRSHWPSSTIQDHPSTGTYVSTQYLLRHQGNGDWVASRC